MLANTLFVYVIMRFGISVGGFVPKTYVQQVVENSDFRKYDDGLRMILDCTPELESALTQRPGRGGRRRNRALRPAPAGRGDDDLLHALGAAQRPRPFHRRRARRLCLGGDRAEGDGGVSMSSCRVRLCERPGMTVAQRPARVQFSPPQSAPMQPSTFSVSGPANETWLT